MIVRLHRVWHTECGQCSAKGSLHPFLPSPSHTSSYLCTHAVSGFHWHAFLVQKLSLGTMHAENKKILPDQSPTSCAPHLSLHSQRCRHVPSWGTAQRVHTSSHCTGPDATREGRRCGACEAGSRRPTLLLPTQTHAHALPLACRTLSSGTPGPQTHQHRAPCMCLSCPPYLDAPRGTLHASVRCRGMGEGLSSLSYPCLK